MLHFLILPLLFFVAVALCTFAYHYERNGNPANWGDFICRLIWAAAFGTSYAILTNATLNVFLVGAFTAGAFAEIFIPHAFAQNMGRWPHPWAYDQDGVTLMTKWKYWPGLWLPQYTQLQWDVLTDAEKTLLDFLGMMSVGFLRGLIVFGLAFVVSHYLNCGLIWHACIWGWIITTLWQPFAYLTGRYMNFALWDNAADSSEWGEFLIGPGWVVALMVTLCVSGLV